MFASAIACQSAQDVRIAAVRAANWRRHVWFQPQQTQHTPEPVQSPAPTVKQMPSPSSTTRRLIKAVIAESARRFSVRVEDVLGRRRLGHHVHARQVAMHLIRKNTPLSLPRIGVIFGRDHTTVLHAVRAVSSSTKLQQVAVEIAAAAQAALAEDGGATDAH